MAESVFPNQNTVESEDVSTSVNVISSGIAQYIITIKS